MIPIDRNELYKRLDKDKKDIQAFLVTLNSNIKALMKKIDKLDRIIEKLNEKLK